MLRDKENQRNGKLRCRSIGANRLAEFLAKGYRKRDFFPHFYYQLPKAGPDGYRLGSWMCNVTDPAAHREIVLYSSSPTLDDFPDTLFFDRELIWHEQHFGIRGQVASANLVITGSKLFGNTYLSDLVQRISRQRTYKTRIENRLSGWTVLLLNAIMNFAREHGMKTFHSPTADLVMKYTDRNRTVDRALFDRIYDRIVQKHLHASRQGLWWRVDIAENLDRLIIPEIVEVEKALGKRICICHDIERGLGHVQSDPQFASSVDAPSRDALTAMLRIEERSGVRATYHVVGCFLDQVRDRIVSGGHACAFHSYDHVVRGPAFGSSLNRLVDRTRQLLNSRLGVPHGNSLKQCRSVDYRLKGYRPAQSRITTDLSDANLSFYNFEWLASSADSLSARSPYLQNGIVKIPIVFDDFALYRDHRDYDEWLRGALRTIETHDFVAFSLHDCYAQFWLSGYERLIEAVLPLGRLATLDEVSAETLLAHAL